MGIIQITLSKKELSMRNYLIVLLFATLYSSGTLAKGLPDQEIDKWFETAVTHEHVPGITVAVGGPEGVVYAKGFGFADLENSLPMTTEHKVRIGSVSKLIATAGLMRLYDQGKVDLDKPVIEYAPAWSQDKPALSLRQLTSHTAGIRHYKAGADEFLLNKNFTSINESLTLFKDDPLLFTPGEKFTYSTFAWTLVSAAMEGADNKRNFTQIIQQEVFEPLGLKDTSFDDQYEIISHRAQPYSVYQDKLFNSPQTDHSYKWAGGGFISTPSDVVRFAVAHLQNDYLKPETVNLMFTPAKLNNGDGVNFGIGWMVGFNSYKNRDSYKDNEEVLAMMESMPNAVMHSGGSMGGITMLIMCTDHKRAVTVVKNVNGDDSADVFALALKTLHVFHKEDN
ncbi:serine hydrolase domain-containing protein [Glaciecola sp. 1036]|uniref:serine hydrolase domain-containing protein n=1 Tax=Alteromonadaceae TaxID=72275 RepID=UPI003D045871